jgi:hypothetical protein
LQADLKFRRVERQPEQETESLSDAQDQAERVEQDRRRDEALRRALATPPKKHKAGEAGQRKGKPESALEPRKDADGRD